MTDTTSTATIKQQRGAHTTRFSLVSETEMEIELSSRRSAESYRINLSQVSAKPSRQSFKAGAVNTRVFLLASIAIIFVFSALGALSDFPGLAIFFALLSIPFIGFCVYEIRKLRATSFDAFIYEFRFGGRAFILETSKPNKDEVDEFRTNLESAIAANSTRENLNSDGDGLSSRITKLHELFKSGILNEDEFTSAKSRLLTTATSTERVIGFNA